MSRWKLVLCLFLWAPSLLVNGRTQKEKNFKHRQLPSIRADSVPTHANLTGPHVCGPKHNKFCCPGWSQAPGSSKCNIPICRSSCGLGTCLRPNLCLCPSGKVGPSCKEDKKTDDETRAIQHVQHVQQEAGCAVNCMNGGTCAGIRCICIPGFIGPHCGQPQCATGCLNGGRCIAPNRCACVYGFTGRRCEADYRTGPCFTQIQDNTCRGQLTGVVCTKVLCCATIGEAWGLPCEQCRPTPHPCRRGYIYNAKNKNCQDIDECKAIPNLCVGGECVNTVGSYRCGCKEGQTRNPRTGQCEDVNECDTIPNVCLNGQCINTESGYFCRCNDGFELSADRKSCIGTKVSSCYRTFINGSCGDPTEKKLSIKQCCCDVGVGWGTNGYCQLCPSRNSARYQDLCVPSTLSKKEDMCDMLGNPCKRGKCISTPGSYTCRCFPGYKLDEDGTTCIDANECTRQGICYKGKCINTEGSFTCECPDGFMLSKDKTYCTDMNECETDGMCPNGICENMDGSYKCVCKPGFKQSPDQQICVDIDECSENGKICLHGQCINTAGSYRCRCDPGFILSSDGAFCLDEDECTKSGMCANGKCVNMEGTYKCVCNPGYTSSQDEQYCIDINECEKLDDACHNGQCINTQGSFRCECPLGLTLATDGRTCITTIRGTCFRSIRDDACLNPTATLVTISECCCMINDMKPLGVGWGIPCQACPEVGSDEYKMYCKNYPPPDKDINECALYPDICENGACENIEFGYRCRCNPGYIVDASGKRCVDVDECATGEVCSGGRCHNIPGSYRCQCPIGFQYNERLQECVDQQECELQPNLCRNADCINIPGSFRCECRDPNFTLDSTGRVCVDKRTGMCWRKVRDGRCEDSIGKVHREDCCSSLGVAWGSPCELCPPATLPRKCPKGFSFQNGLDCKDVNECELFVDVCQGGGSCVNTPGSFQCVCPDWMTLDPSGTRCMDMREDVCYSTFTRGQCKNPFSGSYRRKICCCTIGEAWGSFDGKCLACPADNTNEYRQLCGRKGLPPDDKKPGMNMDVNECVMFPNICGNGQCRNTVGSFICDCNSGFTLTADGKNCTDIDECSIASNVCGNGTCQNEPGRFTCKCDEGFESTMMMQMCMDIDECALDPSLCRGGRCENTQGSFICVCPEGHELMPGGKSCKDVDECSTDSDICSNGRCENFMGGYECICDPGFKENPLKTSCVDIDECRVNNGGCETNCINNQGSFTCTCMDGYTLGVDGRTCIDADECDEPDTCRGGDCVNVPGSFVCRCPSEKGVMPSVDQKMCIDIDECAINPNLCLNGKCKNTFGSFICDCPIGFSSKGPRQGCTDDNECELGADRCDPHADCTNTLGSYTCKCRKGFTGNGLNCRDINECVEDNGGCSQNAGCINTAGSYSCVCDDGFEGDGSSCRDVDECSLNGKLCENGQCLNYPGGYRCECDMGFAPQETDKSCQDINECEMFRNLCVNGRCENVFGMFRCICNKGFKLDETGGNCTDINECEDPQNCLHGECINRVGSYVCQCPPNYELSPSGNGCVDNRQGNCYLVGPPGRQLSGLCRDRMGGDMTRTTCCCTVGAGWGQTPGGCDTCPPVESEEYKKLCVGGPGFRPNNITVILEDIDECKELPGICNNGKCVNTFGSFKCTCELGYTTDDTGRRCVDKNECENPALCGIGTCQNTVGSYKCVCPDGHMLTPDNNCMDMRPGVCSVEAYNTTGPRPQLVCRDNLSQNLTWKQCCCSIGQAWSVANEGCKSCPRWRTTDYTLLCGEKGKVPDSETGNNVDLNECELVPELCENGECINTVGSFRCQCHTGYQYINYRRICEDIDECLTERPCLGLARCENTKGSFICVCPDGYKLGPERRSCVDIDECEEPGICENGECRNLAGSFQCQCNRGYRLTTNRLSCIDINECQLQPMCRNGTCENTEGSYRCQCNPGFKLINNNVCTDVNECFEDPRLCNRGRCVNTVGSFTCDCPTGYIADTDGRNCVDKDECRAMPGLCRHGECVNFAGGFECRCDKGFEQALSGQECVDVNECVTMPGACYNGECENTLGSFQCTCPKGFVRADNGKMCMDMRKGYCYRDFIRGQCLTPRPKNVTRSECCCSKGAGWIPEFGGTACELCPVQGEEAFLKLCPDIGYTGPPGMEPMDIDECANDPNLCVNGICINTDGSYRCDCLPGYRLDRTGVRCVDVDECRTQPSICGNGTCTNVDGSFECSCRTGFAPGPAQTCVDVNECTVDGNECAFRCHNMYGSYKCMCPRGFKLSPDGKHCQDEDECATPANNCRFACKNLVGSFMCVCPPGFRGSGDDCRDINECEEDPTLCKNGRCRNIRGSYRCRCDPGYGPSPDRKYCLDQRAGYCFDKLNEDGNCVARRNMQRMTKDKCCCINNAAWGPLCEKCPKPGTVEFNRLCTHGPGFEKGGKDIDECARMPGACENGRCLNTMGSYRCLCKVGYKTDPSGSRCVDIDECETIKPCAQNCTNTLGSYVCSCGRGYILDGDGRKCNDIDECKTSRHGCPQNCVNTVGSYMCGCGKGYRMEGEDCNDINECEEDKNLCQPGGTCENTQGGFKCTCPRGFKPDSTGRRCIDQDECESDRQCQYGCINLVGSYRCQCPEGFIQHFYWNRCIDDNECNQPGVCGAASCYNTVGAYQCSCGRGQVFEPSGMSCVGVGGSGCGGQPCNYGCIPTTQGFMCGCPSGYQQVGQGHCISTVSPPGSELPEGIDLPHVANPGGEDNLPPGEGCYECGADKNGVPLERPYGVPSGSSAGLNTGALYQPSGGYANLGYGYNSYQTGYNPSIQGDQRGYGASYNSRGSNRGYRGSSHSNSYQNDGGAYRPSYNPGSDGYQNDYLYQNDYPYDYDSYGSQSRGKRDLSAQNTAVPKQKKKQPRVVDMRGGNIQQPQHQHYYGNSTARGEKPVVVYVRHSIIRPGMQVLRWLPALAALKNNEVCKIYRGNEDGLLSIAEEENAKFIVTFTKEISKRLTRNVYIRCDPIRGEGETINKQFKLEAFKIWLQLRIS